MKPEGEMECPYHNYFKFLAPWLEHDGFHHQVEQAWKVRDPWNSNIRRLTTSLARWNNDVYGNIFRQKKRILACLEGIDRKLLESPNERLSHLKKELWTHYNTLLDHEEAYWFHQARSNWLSLGDRNTRYFHQKTLVRRRMNKIEALLNDQDVWVYDDQAIRGALIG